MTRRGKPSKRKSGGGSAGSGGSTGASGSAVGSAVGLGLDVLSPEDRLVSRPWAASARDLSRFLGSPLWSDILAMILRRVEQARSELETMSDPRATAYEQGRIAAYREIATDVKYVMPTFYAPAAGTAGTDAADAADADDTD